MKKRNAKNLFLPSINEMQKKAIDLFYACLKNKNTFLIFSPYSNLIVVYSEDIWVSLGSASNSAFMINIVEKISHNESCSHEISVPIEYIGDMRSEFSDELEKRTRMMEHNRKKIITKDFENLIKKMSNE
jgi:hypothetical protein